MLEASEVLLKRCVSIDLEVDPRTALIFGLAAVWRDGARVVLSGNEDLHAALDRLEGALHGDESLIGHNILRHDLPHLVAQRPRLASRAGAPIDTLWLNPLAFPRNPYHHLVKHYQDGRLQAGHVNDPEADARLVFDVLQDQLAAFRDLNGTKPDALTAYHYLTTRQERSGGFDALFGAVRGLAVPSPDEARQAVRKLLAGRACLSARDALVDTLAAPASGWPTAYALSWISVAGGDSVMPPWVRRQFPEAARTVRGLRDASCSSAWCPWCREKNNPVRALARWFGFEAYRPRPVDDTGRPLQERIVEEAMRGKSLLGILPTGTGKSVCYQVPALSRFEKTGALTVVISPLVALMADQVNGMVRAGISSAVTVNGMLSMPERQDALDKVRMGDAAILLISPEQLRSRTVRSVLAQREVGLWVLDEAHCLSKWGHDFRPDYRYIGRFIKAFSGDQPTAPILCLTATAKPEVIEDIRAHFKERLDLDLALFDGGTTRTNLSFAVQETRRDTKLGDILDTIESHLPEDGYSGAIVYCATRARTEHVAAFLKQQGLSAAHFHAGLKPDEKREVQERFRTGELRVIAATNAFGMGIDKPDIRLVVHGDIPGSLENYLQEAGRAGRDQGDARCVLLYASEDVERQFSLSARSRLGRHEIGAILKAIRRLDDKTRRTRKVVATTGEIIREEEDGAFGRENATDDTRVKIAVSWLEEADLLAREENHVEVYPSSLRIRSIGDAEALLQKQEVTATRRKQLADLVRHLVNATPDEGITTDELAGVCGLTASGVSKAMADLEAMGILRNDVPLTVFVHVGGEKSSQQRLTDAAQLEVGLLHEMQEIAPDVEDGTDLPVDLTRTCQVLREAGHAAVRPDMVERILRGWAADGRDQDGGKANIRVRKTSRAAIMVGLQRSWSALQHTVSARQTGAERLLAHLAGKVPKGVRGKDIQVETTTGELLAQLNGDAFLRASIQDMNKLLSRALMWMHEQDVVALGKGLAVFRPAMTLYLSPRRDGFTQRDFAPLQAHYDERTVQTHVMAAFAELGLQSIDRALTLSQDYFVLDQDTFLRRWLPHKGNQIRRQTTGASWRSIVESLNNSVQQKIVSDDREQTSVLVLAGPGSGKTRVLVHRIAYLIRVRREDPRGILVLSYNRHAATEIRSRLRVLIGDDAQGVTISTCHALAMRLVGSSFDNAGQTGDRGEAFFDDVLSDAARLLTGEGLDKAEAEAQRVTLIEGYRWILVDEYQDIGTNEYAFIAAVAGRSIEDPELRLSLFAVGDDDQNIYAFKGASVQYIRQFEEDYKARAEFLIENYRSTHAIVEAANFVIASAADRMKAGQDIKVDGHRAKSAAGGELAAHDPVSQGRVQLLKGPANDTAQAVAAIDELLRLSRLLPQWDWARVAIIARNWDQLVPAHAYAHALGIPVELANEGRIAIWRLREMRAFIATLRAEPRRLWTVDELEATVRLQEANAWTQLILDAIEELAKDVADKRLPVPDLVEWFGEWARNTRSRQRGLLLLTAHRAKGLEFDHVVILDGAWRGRSRGEDPDAPRRLFYVAMTRARQSLTVLSVKDRHPYLVDCPGVLVRRVRPKSDVDEWTNRIHIAPSTHAVDLSFAGRLSDRNPALGAIAAARAGDPINLVNERGQWLLRTKEGTTIGRMASTWSPPEGCVFVEGRVGAIVQWRMVDNEEPYRATIERDAWETVLPDLVFGR